MLCCVVLFLVDPHPLQAASHKSFACLCILSKPVLLSDTTQLDASQRGEKGLKPSRDEKCLRRQEAFWGRGGRACNVTPDLSSHK